MMVVAGYFATLLAFVCVDMLWLSLMVERLYRPALGNLLATNINLPAAIVFYLLFPVGLMIFAVLPAVKSGTISHAPVYGALLGLFSYATYDLTNQATLRAWSTQLSIIDMSWGLTLGGFAATIGYLATRWFAA